MNARGAGSRVGVRRVVALALVLNGAAVGAAPVVFESDPWRSLAPHRDTRRIALADIDVDGDLDLVFGDAAGGLALYRNNYGRLSARTPDWTGALTGAAVTGLCLGDIDGDGDPDLVCSQADAPLALFRNVDGSFTGPAELLGAGLPARDIALADLDNDRDLDLVVACDGAPSRWLPNVDGVLRPELAVMLGTGTTSGAVAVGDLDGDGWLDIVLANSGALHRVLINDGGDLTTDSFFLPVFQPGIPTAVALGDISGDGLLDIIVATSANTIRTHVNGGDRTFTHFDQGSGPRAANGLEPADLDGDGRLDLAYTTSAATAPVSWLRNTGAGWAAAIALGGLPPGGMQAIALSDLDEDGDLDLVGATDGASGEVVLWRSGGLLETAASWTAQVAGVTYGLAMADLDQDGDLDVVQGNFAGPDAIFLNTDGEFAALADHTFAEGWETTGLVVTDWDRDGDPDLLFSNNDPDQPIRLHRNVAGAISPAAESLTAPATPAWSLAVVDLDDDGFADLVTGGTGELRVALRDAAGDGFRESLVLGVFDRSNWYNYLALADIDGDGDDDLAAALANGQDVVFRNRFDEGASLETMWRSPVAHRTGFVSLADLDGDAVPDLTVGYAEASIDNDWFRGDGAGFDVPGRRWGTQSRATWQVEMSDWDGDGYADLLEAEVDGPNRLLGNRAGTIDQADTPLWTAIDSAATFRLAAGDLDDDGDLDLWAGNSGQPDQIFRGVVNPGPTNPGAPAPPALSATSAHLRRLRPSSGAVNRIIVACEVVDADGDPVTVIGRCRPVGSPAWIPVETHRELAGARDGIRHELTFDVSTWPDSDAGYVLQLRSIESSRRLAGQQYAPRHEIRLTDVDIRRPERVIAVRDVTMPTLTVGGVSRATFTVANRGNETLLITGAVTSRPQDLTLALPPSPEIAPGQSLELELVLAPTDTTRHGTVVISTNDPRAAGDTLNVFTDIRSLEFDFNFLLEAGATAAPLGASLTGLLAPRDGVDMEEGWLHYRRAGSGPFRSLALSPLDGAWLAVIPGAEVTESGLEYYLEARNGSTTVTTPPADPESTPRFQAVEAPRGLSSQVQPHSDAGILADRDVFIRIVPAQGTVFSNGLVHYRRGGEAEFQSTPVQPDSTARIPAEAVGPRGLEFHVDARTATAELREPRTGEQFIRVQVPALSEPAATPARRYRMVTVPLDFGDFSGTIGDLLTDQGEFGPYDVTRWRCLRYLPAHGAYGELSAPGLATDFRPEPGRAFWLIAAQANRLDSAPVVGRSVPTSAPYPVTVAPGWNQVGNPYAFAVDWADVDVIDTGGAAADSLVTTPLTGDGETIDVLPPFRGFWLKNLAGGDLQLRFPAREAAAKAETVPLRATEWQAAEWELRIVATGTDAAAAFAVVGARTGARLRWDPLDQPLPPPAPDRRLRVYLDNGAWSRFPGPYQRDLRPPAGAECCAGDPAGYSWDFTVEHHAAPGTGPLRAEVSLEGTDALPASMRAVLIDRQLQKHITLGPGTSYEVLVRGAAPSDAQSRFRLLVGTADYIGRALDEATAPTPPATVLLPCTPNPFNPATALRYELAQAGRVRLRVYDLRGFLVRELVAAAQAAGRYEVLWDGCDDQGQGLSAGLYFARLEAGGGVVGTMKMTLLN